MSEKQRVLEKRSEVRYETSLTSLKPESKARLNKLYYEDYAFSTVLSKKTQDKLGLKPNSSKEETNESILKACSDDSIVKIINVHGWNGAKEIWEVKSRRNQDRKSFSEEEIDLIEREAQKQGKTVMVINVDSNGWGKSKITAEGKEMLAGGPDVYYKKLGLHVHEAKPRPWMTIQKAIADSAAKRNLPGSIENATEAMRMLIEELGITGDVIFFGHSQGGRIIRHLLDGRDQNIKHSNLNIIACGVAAAETGVDLSNEKLVPLFTFFDVLQNKQATALVKVGEAISKNVINRIVGGRLTRSIATGGNLDPEVSGMIDDVHGSQISAENIPLLVTQAFTWQGKSRGTPLPLMVNYRGRQDSLTPNDAYQAWVDRSRYRLDREDAVLFDQQANEPIVLEGPHYFMLNPDNQKRIIGDIADLYTRVSLVKDGVDSALDSILFPPFNKETSMWNQFFRQSIRFAHIDGYQPQGSLLERLQKAKAKFQSITEGKDVVNDYMMKRRRSFTAFPMVIPLTADEMYRMHQRFYTDLNYQVRQALFGITSELDDRFIESVGEDFIGNGKNEITFRTLISRAEAFPFHLYVSGIKSESELRQDLNQWLFGLFDSKDGVLTFDDLHINIKDSENVIDTLVDYYQKGKAIFESVS